MKVAKNMDSVFSASTQDELEFDIYFDDDDSIIDTVAGCDENGNPWTGPDPEDVYQKDGDGSNDDPAEGSKDEDLEVGGEVGDGKEVSGKEDSAESKADEVTPDIKKAIGESSDPLTDDDEAERAGKEPKDIGTVNTEATAKEVVDTEYAKLTKEPVKDADTDNILTQEAEKVCETCGKPMSECKCSQKEATLSDLIVKKITEAPEVTGSDPEGGAAPVAEETEVYDEAFDQYLEEASADPKRKAIANKTAKAVRDFFTSEGYTKTQVGGLFIGGKCAQFLKGEGDTYLYAINYSKTKYGSAMNSDGSHSFGSSSEDKTDKLIKFINKNKDKIKKVIEEATGTKVTKLGIEEGRLGVINLAVTYDLKDESVSESSLDALIDSQLESATVALEEANKAEEKAIVEAAVASLTEAELTSPIAKDLVLRRVEAVKERVAELKAAGLFAGMKEAYDTAVSEGKNPNEAVDNFLAETSAEATDSVGVEDFNKEDEEARDGKNTDTKNVEGKKQDVIGAALEAGAEGDVDDLLSMDPELNDNPGLDDKIVPDSVQKADDENKLNEMKELLDVEEGCKSENAEADAAKADEEAQKALEKDPSVKEPTTESVVFKGWLTPHVIEEAESAAEEEVKADAEDMDDQDIEAVKDAKDSDVADPELDYTYDDDELIDMAINGSLEDEE